MYVSCYCGIVVLRLIATRKQKFQENFSMTKFVTFRHKNTGSKIRNCIN